VGMVARAPLLDPGNGVMETPGGKSGATARDCGLECPKRRTPPHMEPGERERKLDGQKWPPVREGKGDGATTIAPSSKRLNPNRVAVGQAARSTAVGASYGATLMEDATFTAVNEMEARAQLWCRDEKAFRGGQLREQAWFWEEVLLPASGLAQRQQDAILRWVTTGVTAAEFLRHFKGVFGGKDYDSAAPPKFIRKNHPMKSEVERQFTDSEVARWVRYGAAREVKEQPHCCLPLGVAHGKKLRLIWDGRMVNCWTPSPSMTYENLRSFQRGIEENAWMFSLDHKMGYQHVPLAEDAQNYFGFRWRGRFYQFMVLPFGWAPACYVYDTLSGVVAAWIRQMGIHCIKYLDDFGFALSAGAHVTTRRRTMWKVWAIFYFAGYTLARDKSMMEADRVMSLLGFGLDSVRQCYFVPEKKLSDMLDLVRDVTAKGRCGVSVLALQSLVGKAQSMSLAVPPISIFLRSSYAALSRASKSDQLTVRLDEETILDLQALENLKDWQRLSLWPAEQHIRLDLGKTVRMETDASMTGWGAVMYKGTEFRTADGVFASMFEETPIHIKEMWAAQRALLAFAEQLRGYCIDLYTDNTVVQHTLLRGSSKVPELQAFAKELLQYQLQNNVIVRVYRVTTAENFVADALSRQRWIQSFEEDEKLDRNDHMLTLQYFETVQKHYGHSFTIDACAHARNARVRRYVARYQCLDPNCVAVNALAYTFPMISGVREQVYCNPPWSLITPLWRHFRLCRLRGVMVVPRFPQEQWFGLIQSEAVAVWVVAVKGDLDVFRQPSLDYKASLGPVPWDILACAFDFD
jgi:hypothetical protein